MAYDVAGLTTKVRTRVRDTGYSSSEILGYLNDELQAIKAEHADLPQFKGSTTYTVTIGDSDITHGSGLPTDFGEATKLTLTTTGREGDVDYIEQDELDEDYPDNADTTRYPNGSPLCWYHDGSTIRLFPAPDVAYSFKLRYRKNPATLAAEGDVPVLPYPWEEVLVEGGSYRVFQAKDMYTEAGIHRNQRDDLVKDRVMAGANPNAGRPHVMAINRRIVRPSSTRWR